MLHTEYKERFNECTNVYLQHKNVIYK